MSHYDDLVYGSGEHRHNRGRHVEQHGDTGDDVAELGRTAIKGVVTVGAVGITATMMGGILGGMQKP
jgi:hypothetical protein